MTLDQTRQWLSLPPEQRAIHDRCFHPSGRFVEFALEDIETSIPARFEKIVGLHGERLAIKANSEQWSYERLNRAANRVAHAILKVRGERSEPVGLMFGQGAAAVAAILGVLKAGKFYLPLDPSLPLDRLKEMHRDSTTKLIVSSTEHLPTARQLGADLDLINTDSIELVESAEDPRLAIPSDALAYIVYTSGSTGQPKGVMQSHRYVLYQSFELGQCLHICPEDRASLQFPWSFSGGGHTIYSTLLHGAALFPIDLNVEGLRGLARLLKDERITLHHSTPTVLRELAKVLDPTTAFADLRLVRFGGESVAAADVRLCVERFCPLLVNGLASTEGGTLARYFFDRHSRLEDHNAPSGYSPYGKQVLILDDHNNPTALNQVGEIAVKSAFLSPGYWRQPELTAGKFLASPDGDHERVYLTGDLGRVGADGCLYHLGRKDFQVKIRGFRVELAEVEAALLKQKGVKEATVIGRADGSGSLQLAAYVIPAETLTPAIEQLKRGMRAQLPEYMIPTTITFLDVWPLTPTGKINRAALPEPDAKRPNLDTPYVAPRTAIELQLANLWGEILELAEVGIHDNFFDLGGHSLAATRIVSRVLKQFQLEIPLHALFDAPTIAEMAKVVSTHQGDNVSSDKLERLISEIEAMTDEEARKLLAAKNTNDNNP